MMGGVLKKINSQALVNPANADHLCSPLFFKVK